MARPRGTTETRAGYACCDQAAEYVLRVEREASEYFRPSKHCFGENLDRWLAGQPDRLSHIEEIKQHANKWSIMDGDKAGMHRFRVGISKFTPAAR